MAELSWTNTRLGRYEVKERIGKGGMAQVFKGFDSNLDRTVAIKVLYENLSDDPTFKERFEREAKFVASFNHPNIVQVYDFDSVDRGDHPVYFMVMPYIPGQTLKDILADLMQDEILPKERVMQITRDLADALDYAHLRGMVHRDVKPGNIMFDERDRAVLTDFGIARLVSNSGLTQEGLTVGTPAYMSPEQATGEMVDARADIYALGVIVYEMLAGHPPFGSDSSLSILLKHLHEPVPSLKTFTHMPDEALDAVIFMALAKNPEDRFQTAGAFADALEAAVHQKLPAMPTASSSARATVRMSEDRILATGVKLLNAETTRTIQFLTEQVRTVTRSPIGILGIGLVMIAFVVIVGFIGQQLNRIRANVSVEDTGGVNLTVDEGGDDTADSMTDDSASSMSGALYFASTFTSDDPFLAMWPQDENEQAIRLVTDDGFYRFENLRLDRGMTSIFAADYTYTDATVSMTARLEEGSAVTAGYGIIFRYLDADNYNVFTVDGQGRYSIWVRRDSAWRELRNVPDPWTPSEAVNPIGEINTLSVDIVDDEFIAYVNGTMLVKITDETFDEGAVGIYLASTRSNTASLLVDAFSVDNVTSAMTEPEGGS